MPKLSDLKRLFHKNPRQCNADSPFALSLSLPMSIALGVVLICGVGWAFFMGFMVGRGQSPETGISQLTGGLLETGAPATQARSPAAIEQPDSPAPAEMDNKPAAPPASAGQFPFSKPGEAGLAAWDKPPPAIKDEKPKERPAAKSGAPKRANEPAAQKAKSGRDGALYDYTYQVSALRGANEATEVVARLKKAGLKASSRKSGKVWLVIVTGRMNEAGAETLRGKIRTFNLGRPLLLSKKPATGTPAKKGK